MAAKVAEIAAITLKLNEQESEMALLADHNQKLTQEKETTAAEVLKTAEEHN